MMMLCMDREEKRNSFSWSIVKAALKVSGTHTETFRVATFFPLHRTLLNLADSVISRRNFQTEFLLFFNCRGQKSSENYYFRFENERIWKEITKELNLGIITWLEICLILKDFNEFWNLKRSVCTLGLASLVKASQGKAIVAHFSFPLQQSLSLLCSCLFLAL